MKPQAKKYKADLRQVQCIPAHRMTNSQVAFYRLFKKGQDEPPDRWRLMADALEKEPCLATSVVYLNIWTAIHFAAASDDAPALAIVEKLLKDGLCPDISVEGAGRTPLMAAAFGNHCQSAKLLLEYGADPNARNDGGATALHEALSLDVNFEVIQLLLNHGADPNVSDLALNTPLHEVYGRLHGRLFFLDLKQKHQDDDLKEESSLKPKAKERREKRRLEEENEARQDLNRLGEAASLMLAHGADPNRRNHFGRTPQECLKYGFGRNESESLRINISFGSSARDFYRPLSSFFRAAAERLRDYFSSRLYRLRFLLLPASAGLTEHLKIIPDKYKLPPASTELLAELNSTLGGLLPVELKEIYQDHSGFAEYIDATPFRLLNPDEVMQKLWSYANEDYYILRPFSDGQTTCLFWSNCWNDYAGVYLSGPLKGRVFLTDYGSPAPCFKDVISFYRWQLKGGAEADFDYPERRTPDLDSDRILSQLLFKHWLESGRQEEGLGLEALELSGPEDTSLWINELSAILDRCDYSKTKLLGDCICEYLGELKCNEAVEILTKSIKAGRQTAMARNALKMIGT